MIISYLPRSNVQNMRLVNKEFEEKVSQYLFRTVVVPFKPEIYDITKEPITGGWQTGRDTCDGLQSSAAVMLQDKGMRVFQGFGRHIQKFAMSFEFNYDLLTKPPVKSNQEAITTFWGIYRWPLRRYNRYAQLEGLEQIADETRTMTKALQFIENARELGLSIDGGLGWLTGPDVNPRVPVMHERVAVFGDSRFPPEEKQNASSLNRSKSTLRFNSTARLIDIDSTVEANSDASRSNGFARILSEAGYEGFDLTQSVRTLMESEGLLQPSQPVLTNSLSPSEPSDSPRNVEAANVLLRHFGYEGAILERMRTLLNFHDSTRRLASLSNNSAESFSSIIHSAELKYFPLKPNDLTNAQKEMLLETEWAQRAFMQSYAIAIIDNPATFQNIVTLTIARLPSRHLAILRRGDFWTSLSQLNKVSLAVIPDWRDITKLSTSWVEDIRLSPSQAIWGVYKLLKDHIAPQKSIKSFRFEWLCGGEEATGLFARNQLILATPLVPQAMDMVTRIGRPKAVLALPFVEHLTLKNCWISPHIFVRFVTAMKKQALQSLTLHSFSLSAPARHNAPPGPPNPANILGQVQAIGNAQAQAQAVQAQAVVNLIQMQGIPAGGPQMIAVGIHMQQDIQPQMGLPQAIGQGQAQAQPVSPSQQAANPNAWLDQPRDGSWAQVIDSITPFNCLASLRYARDVGPEPPVPEPTSLKRVSFNSCGYVRLPLDLDQSMLDPPNPVPVENGAISKRRNELEQYMMKPQEHTLGTIVDFISENEIRTLESAWNLRMGWGSSRRRLAAQAIADGIRVPGRGRFRGSIVTQDIDLRSVSL
jgi:hypothetical protein